MVRFVPNSPVFFIPGLQEEKRSGKEGLSEGAGRVQRWPGFSGESKEMAKGEKKILSPYDWILIMHRSSIISPT